MSKAFTKEESAEAPLVLTRRAPLPEGVPNYVTAEGLAAYRHELDALKQERAALGPTADELELAGKQPALNARIAELEGRIGSAALVDATQQPRDEVRFGARVSVRAAGGVERSYRIVGVDEADAAEGRVAFVAPLARALLGQHVGDAVIVRTPHGEDELEVLSIRYG